MKRTALFLLLTAAVLGGLFWALEAAVWAPGPPLPVAQSPRQGGTDITFFVTADTHPGFPLFHGHYHKSARTWWKGHDVYNVGSPKHLWRSFAVVHVTDTTMTVVSRDWVQNAWRWSHVKPINQKR